ncbi:hypothetical protein JANAI62_01220 [Jannaschia pagri]|uniref:TRAP transporter small permease protein n=1 Tax=Jannaschia pagri TaxID=2829797 RepID=A0ABQ4NGE8_9RHOB|nr:MULTISPECIES: TRAP transporter small permease subunit [unclassified Jannaschia]GIT90396.1 hypothetical protein JANAI61_08540 [Jannaschia sp. AI_61]GIT93499.1 hypothetical protein JANAI62_01220 [Jannaschia sp. AI_62]
MSQISHSELSEEVEGQGAAAAVAISDPGEVGREQHNSGDRFIVKVSNVFAWLFPILMIAICLQVFLRNGGRMGIGPGNLAWLDDLQWWIYGAAVLIGVAYAVTTNSHVRVDIFYDNYKSEKQRKIDIFALTWLFLPFLIMCWDVTLDYALSSVRAGEGSDSPNGLHRLYLLKIFMNLSFIFMAAATWFAYVRALSQITTPLWWKKLLFAFPSTWFAIQLAVWYVGVGLTIAFTEASTTREATRTWFYDEIELLPGQDAKITVMVALVLTLALIGLLYARRDRSAD